jgi:hypothetical protein
MTCTNNDIGKLIGSYELDLLTEKEKRQFENHLLDCDFCLQNLYRTAPIAKMIRERKLAPAGNIDISDEMAKDALLESPKKSRQTWVLGKKWLYAVAGAVAIMAIVITVLLLQAPWKETERLRGHDDVSILVVSPVGEVADLREIRWKAIAGIDSYELKIYTGDGSLVWEKSVTGNSVSLPDSISNLLIPGQSYFWQVETLTAKEERMKSQVVRFKIRK